MRTSSFSLKKKLLLWISIPVLIAGLFIAVLAFMFSWHEIEEVYDAQLVHSAKVLLQMTERQVLEADDIALGKENPSLQHKYENKMAFRIWHNDKLIAQSRNAENFRKFEAPPGFSDQYLNEDKWRFFVFIDAANAIRVETSELYTIRYEMIEELMMSLIIPATIFIPVIFLIIWLGVNQSLSPLIKLSAIVNARHSDDLTRIEMAKVPQEVMPLFDALNNLFTRIADSFKREREFTDHAAHELRTPLAAMKTQTQVLMKKSAKVPESSEGFENLNSTIDRATHLIEQLLSFARLQNEKLPLEEIDFSLLLHNVVADFISSASQKILSVKIDIAEHIKIRGHENSLTIMLRNLLDNAVKYTPSGGNISVYLTPDAIFEIRDTGPGIREQDKLNVFGRFVRADKTGQTGSGLGLAIVKWVVDAHAAKIELKDNLPQGLICRIEFRK